MPLYHYVSMTRRGEWLDGVYEAPDIQTLEKVLEENGLILVTWKGQGKGRTAAGGKNSKPGALNSRAITAEEGRAHWASSPAGRRMVPKLNELAAMLPPVPKFAILQWVIKHSYGAVITRRDALLVLVVCAGFLMSGFYLASHGFQPMTSALWQPVTLPSAAQPEMSVERVDGQRRRTTIFPLQKVRASMVKTALDHVMRQSSLTTQLAVSSDNALEAKATPLDLELVDLLIRAIDNAYGEATSNQVLMETVERMSRMRANWMSVPHPAPAPTPEEQKEDEMQKSLDNGESP